MFFFCFFFFSALLASGALPALGVLMARNASHFAANWPTSRSNEFEKKIKKKWRRPTHGFLHLKSLVRQADERSCKLMSFRLGFSREISPSHFMTKNSQTRTHRLFFPSVLKQLSSDTVKGCSSSS